MPDSLEIALPRGARRHSSLRLLTWHPRGILNAAFADKILHFIDLEEATRGDAFDRFIDLSELSDVHLSFTEVERIAARRIATYQGPPVKSAILAFNPLAFGMARMYEQLMRRSPIEVRVFCRLSSASHWLGAPIEVLASER